MSVDKWAYSPETCDGRACPGDCDNCEWLQEHGEEINKEDVEKLQAALEKLIEQEQKEKQR